MERYFKKKAYPVEIRGIKKVYKFNTSEDFGNVKILGLHKLKISYIREILSANGKIIQSQRRFLPKAVTAPISLPAIGSAKDYLR